MNIKRKIAYYPVLALVLLSSHQVNAGLDILTSILGGGDGGGGGGGDDAGGDAFTSVILAFCDIGLVPPLLCQIVEVFSGLGLGGRRRSLRGSVIAQKIEQQHSKQEQEQQHQQHNHEDLLDLNEILEKGGRDLN